MYETGIFDVSRFYDRNFLMKTLFDINNKRIPFSTSRQKTDLDQFKIKRHNKFNIICVDLKLEHFELAYKLWLIGLTSSITQRVTRDFFKTYTILSSTSNSERK